MSRRLCFALVLVSMLIACRQAQPPAVTSTKPAATAPVAPPPPPPQTALGKLMSVSRSAAAEAQVLCAKGGGISFVTSDSFQPALDSKSRFSKVPKGVEVFTMDTATACPDRAAQKTDEHRVFLLLKFEGKASVAEDTITWRATNNGLLGRVDTKSSLQDSGGKKYSRPLRTPAKDGCTLAFEIPDEAKGLVWSDGKRKYQLEPSVVAMDEAPPKPNATK